MTLRAKNKKTCQNVNIDRRLDLPPLSHTSVTHPHVA
ncbi:uncharacterized protein METZ01_LOCUS101601, partial [marine metagenome]